MTEEENLIFTTSLSLGKDVVNMVVVQMPKNLSCDWLTRFMNVILLGLSLVEQIYRFYSMVVQRLDYSINIQQYD